MPRGVNLINDKGLQSFREAVIQFLPFSLHKKSNYKKFSDLVYAKTGTMLSESTLRRLMQPEARIKPTFHTVNSVSIGIGYESWNDFLSKNEIEIEFLFLQEINIIEFTRISDFDSFCATVNKYEGTKVFFQVYKRMAMMAVEDRNLDVLSHIFEFPTIYKNRDLNPGIHFFVSILVRKLIQYNLMNQLIPFFAKNTAAQVHLVEWYVDEHNLPGYYGNLLEEYIKYKKSPNDLLFYHTLMALKNIMLNLPPDKNIAEFLTLNEKEYYHLYPKARRLAVLMMHFYYDKEKLEVYLNEFKDLIEQKNQFEKLEIGFFMCRTLFVGRSPVLLKFVVELTKIKKHVAMDLFSKIFQNEISKYEAYILYSEGKIEEGKIVLESHDPKFRFVNSYEISKAHYETIHSIIFN